MQAHLLRTQNRWRSTVARARRTGPLVQAEAGSMLQSIARALKEAKGHASQADTNGDGEAGIAATGTTTRVQVLNPPAAVADSRSCKITVCGFELEGVSISGQETCIIVPRCKVAFDIGRCPQRACFQPVVLLSHTHLDHVGGLPFHACTRSMLRLPPSRVVTPPGYGDRVRKLLDAVQALQESDEQVECDIEEVEPGREVSLPSGFMARPFRTTHPITSQGYVLYSQRKKLRADLAGSSQEEIRQMRMAGQEVTEVHEVPEIAFTGDTTADFLDSNCPVVADALRARVLLMELTFLDDVEVDEARGKGHMHIADFVANAHKFQNEAIVLIHFSPRYKRTAIIEALSTMLPPSLAAKCVPLLNGIE